MSGLCGVWSSKSQGISFLVGEIENLAESEGKVRKFCSWILF